MTEHALGAFRSPDDDRDHVASASLDTIAAAAVTKFLIPPSVQYDQGSTPRCVGYSGALERTQTERPEANQAIRFDADDLYAQCKKIDGIPGDGSTVRASVQVQLKTGVIAQTGPNKGKRLKIAEYVRCYTRDEIKAAVIAGGCNIALNWPANWMPDPGRNELPSPSGSVGGHAIVIVGFDDATGLYTLQNSWGSGWGDNGRTTVRYSYVESRLWEAWKTIDAPDPVDTPLEEIVYTIPSAGVVLIKGRIPVKFYDPTTGASVEVHTFPRDSGAPYAAEVIATSSGTPASFFVLSAGPWAGKMLAASDCRVIYPK